MSYTFQFKVFVFIFPILLCFSSVNAQTSQPSCLLAQEVFTMEHGDNINAQSVEPFLHSLYSENDHVISFRVILTERDEKSDYFILTRKGGVLNAYSHSDATNTLQQLNLGNQSLDLIWRTVMQNNLFTIRDEKNIQNFCPEKYRIFNSFTYEFLILSKGKMKKLSYYDPEYYDNVCYGMTERKMVINVAAVVAYVLNK